MSSADEPRSASASPRIRVGTGFGALVSVLAVLVLGMGLWVGPMVVAFQGGILAVLLGGVALLGERLLRLLESGQRIGVESRWSSLTGEASWQLTLATTYLMLWLVLVGLSVTQTQVFVAALGHAP